MCDFHCGIGESLQIEGQVRLYIRGFERDQVWFTVERPDGSKAVVEIISPRDEEGSSSSGPAF